MIWEFVICLLWVFFCTGWLCNDCLVGNVLACWVCCLGQRLEWCLPCLIIHQLIPLCFDHMKLGSLSRWPCDYFFLFLFFVNRPEKCLLWTVNCCYALSGGFGKSQDSLLQILMLQLLTCRLSAAARALSSQRATSPSSSASSTASSGPPTSGSFTRRQSGSQEVLRYRIYLCPHPPFCFKVGGPGNVETGEGEVSNWLNLISLVVIMIRLITNTKWLISQNQTSTF